ncbi:MAG: PKD domain-containing protein [Clostridia bacterium]|nr:PKD domain-containing protein [Clostridia bacterium]
MMKKRRMVFRLISSFVLFVLMVTPVYPVFAKYVGDGFCGHMNAFKDYTYINDMHCQCPDCGAYRNHKYDTRGFDIQGIDPQVQHRCIFCLAVQNHVFGELKSARCSVAAQGEDCFHTIYSINGLPYDQTQHICRLCGYKVAHNFGDPNVPVKEIKCGCGYVCPHSFTADNADSGGHTCGICKHKFVHTLIPNADGSGHSCSDCGYTEKHSFTNNPSGGNHVCFCGAVQAHTYVIGNAANHDCSVCGDTQKHTYISAGDFQHACVCGATGQHFYWDNGDTHKCGECGHSAAHNWVNYGFSDGHACFYCNKTQDHQYVHGRCSICAYQCQHMINPSTHRCTVCGECTHNWSNEFCIYCQEPCPNKGNHICASACGACGFSKPHSFAQDQKCAVCGYVDTVPPVLTVNQPENVTGEGESVMITGTAGDAVEVYVGDGKADLNTDASFSYAHYVRQRDEKLTVTAKDLAGNTATQSISITFTPKISLEIPAQGLPEGDICYLQGSSNFTLQGSETVEIAWGDGTKQQVKPDIGKIFIVGHIYKDNGEYEIEALVKDSGGNVLAGGTSQVSVANAPPALRLGPSGTSHVTLERGLFSLACSFTDPGQDTWSGTVDYGDGSLPEELSLNTDQTFFLKHLYAGMGLYPVTVQIEDKDGGSAQEKLTVFWPALVAPEIELYNQSYNQKGEIETREGNALTLPGRVLADPLEGQVYLMADYNDFLGPALAPVKADNTFELTHTFYDNRPEQTLRLEVLYLYRGLYDWIASRSREVQIRVLNAAPAVELPSAAYAQTGMPFNLAGKFSDPGQDIWEASVDFGDGTPPQMVQLNPDKTFSLNHVYMSPMSCTVRISVSDNQGGKGSAECRIKVKDYLLTLDAGEYIGTTEGGSWKNIISVSGPPDKIVRVTADYGDGSGEREIKEKGFLPYGKTSFTLRYTYPDNGEYTVRVRVTDADGDSVEDTFRVAVDNLAPTVEVPAGDSIFVSDIYQSTGSFSDPGQDTWTATVDYGDDSGPQPLSLDSDKTFQLSHNYPHTGNYTVTVKVTDKDGGVGEGTAQVQVKNRSRAHSYDTDLQSLRIKYMSGGDVVNVLLPGHSGPFNVNVPADVGSIMVLIEADPHAGVVITIDGVLVPDPENVILSGPGTTTQIDITVTVPGVGTATHALQVARAAL